MTRDEHVDDFGDWNRNPKTRVCSACRGKGYRLVSQHIEVECTKCQGKGYLTYNDKDPR